MTVGTSCDCNSGIVTVKLLDKGQVVASAKGVQGKELRLSVQNPTLWSPSNPYLYDMTVSLSKDGKVLDEVKSYTAFRKISSKRDANGIMRMQVRFMRSLSGLEWEPPDAVTCFAGNRQKSSQSAYLCCFACLSPYKWQARLGMPTIEATGIPVVTLVLII